MYKGEGKGFLYAGISAFFSVVMALFVKLAVEAPTETIVFFRVLISFFVISYFVIKGRQSLKTEHLKLHVFRAITGLLSPQYTTKNNWMKKTR